jgi:tetratricopeptide (TPR) repeat protein
METSTSSNNKMGRRILLIALIATALVYLDGVTGQFVFDDPPQIVTNSAVHSWSYVFKYFTSDVWPHTDSSAVGTFYRPIFQLWLLINYKLFGLHTTGWHLSSLLLHLLATFLVFELIRRILNDELVAGISAFLFGLHPIHVESVTWISGSTDPLMAVFCLSALLCYLKSCREKQAHWLVVSWFLYAAAIFSKETAIVLPALIFLYRWLWSSSEAMRSASQRLVESIRAALPYVLITLLYLVARYFALKGLSHALTPLPLNTMVYTWPLVLLFYVRLLLWPFGLSVFYDTPYVTDPNLLYFVLPLILVALIAIGLYLRTKENPAAKFFALWIVLPILPLLNLSVFKEGELAHDRYLYLPSIGLCVLLAMAISRITAGSAMLGLPSGQTMVLIVLGAVFGIVTLGQTTFWKSDMSLATRGAAIAPNNVMANNNLAKELALRGDYQRAIPLFTKVLTRRPNYWLANFNLGFIYYKAGNLPEAERYLRNAVSITPSDAAGYRYLGFALLEGQKDQEAEQSLREAIKLDPSAADQHVALGIILAERNDLDGALREFEAELAINPKSTDAQQQLADVKKKISAPAK